MLDSQGCAVYKLFSRLGFLSLLFLSPPALSSLRRTGPGGAVDFAILRVCLGGVGVERGWGVIGRVGERIDGARTCS